MNAFITKSFPAASPFPSAEANEPPAHVASSQRAPVGPQTVEFSYTLLITRLDALRAPRIAGEPDGDDLRDIADHMIQVADAVDAYFEQIGRMVQSNAPVKIAQELFKHPCFDAIGGNAIFEINRAAEALDQERVT